jgi:hypothetical protein
LAHIQSRWTVANQLLELLELLELLGGWFSLKPGINATDLASARFPLVHEQLKNSSLTDVGETPFSVSHLANFYQALHRTYNDAYHRLRFANRHRSRAGRIEPTTKQTMLFQSHQGHYPDRLESAPWHEPCAADSTIPSTALLPCSRAAISAKPKQPRAPLS